MSDPIKAVQALVGCVHEWDRLRPIEEAMYHVDPGPNGLIICRKCDETLDRDCDRPAPAPDCSTLWGALEAAKQLAVPSFIDIDYAPTSKSILVDMAGANDLVVESEHEACTAICTLILEALDNNKPKEMNDD